MNDIEIRNHEYKQFEDLNIGDIFVFNGCPYIKTYNVGLMQDWDGVYDAVKLNDGSLLKACPDTKVRKIKKVILEVE